MGTRSLTVIYDQDQEKEICVLYRQFDGYPTGHGAELKEFLSGMEITNGIRHCQSKTANGAGCLAAQIIAHFKTDVGGFYLYPAGTRDVWEDYTYIVRAKAHQPIELEVVSGTTIYKGTPEGFDPAKCEDEAA